MFGKRIRHKIRKKILDEGALPYLYTPRRVREAIEMIFVIMRERNDKKKGSK
ncbi:hypothetical protein C1H76_5095 [Elsinoe australis]|uniref:Uncharacterized protein n=1 Tax=Elsinoe australis TaxID=40998 RepID=A0A4U7B039_9PEZI|nr:hypothetical protein C1H76_5095 [Elsinoe australis]